MELRVSNANQKPIIEDVTVRRQPRPKGEEEAPFTVPNELPCSGVKGPDVKSQSGEEKFRKSSEWIRV